MHLVLIETSGNQGFIFATNKLRENVGASELTYQAGTQFVLEAVREQQGPDLWSDDPNQLRQNLCDGTYNRSISGGSPIEVLVATSGKALLLVRTAEIGRSIVATVTQRALQEAPGLDILGVVSDGFDWAHASIHEQVRTVHEQYEQLRGSRPEPATRFPMMPIFAPCSSSGRPASAPHPEGNGSVDLSRESLAKRNNAGMWRCRVKAILNPTSYGVPEDLYQLEEIHRDLDWLAVVHGDGNGLGKIFLEFDWYVERTGGTADPNRAYVNTLRQFSVALEEATESAFITALKELPPLEKDSRWRKRNLLPIVPLVLGGDDLTVLCEGYSALAFTRRYLMAFEVETARLDLWGGVVARIAKKALGCPRLSSCAGVAIIKPHFPFYSAYELSEQLLRSAKNVKQKVTHLVDGKRTPYPCSALDFHILFDSTFTELEAIRARLALENKTRLTAKPYVVTLLDYLDGVTGVDWAKRQHCSELEARIRATGKRDEEGRKKLPNSQLHELREGLFLGRKQADARMRLIQRRYGKEGARLGLAGESAAQQSTGFFAGGSGQPPFNLEPVACFGLACKLESHI